MSSLNGKHGTDLSCCDSVNSNHGDTILNNNSESESIDSNEKLYASPDDSMCGEPFTAQHIVIDFTPKLEEDNEYVQKKCCAFWEFIKSVPEIQNLMVHSVKVPNKSSHGTLETIPSMPAEDDKSDTPEPTAKSILNLINNTGFADVALGTKLPNISCKSLNAKEYKDLEKVTKKTKQSTKGLKSRQKTQVYRGLPSSSPTSEQSYQNMKHPLSLTSMVSKMEKWDANHPKSMKPPGFAPFDEHGVLHNQEESTLT